MKNNKLVELNSEELNNTQGGFIFLLAAVAVNTVNGAIFAAPAAGAAYLGWHSVD